MVKTKIFNKNSMLVKTMDDSQNYNLFLIPSLNIVTKPIMYIMGYATWVKEVDKYFNYIPNNFLNQPDNGDLYTNPKKFKPLDEDHIFKSPFNYNEKTADDISANLFYRLLDYKNNRNK